MRQIAFLRAINVGGHVVTMDRLKKLFVGMGFDEVETFIASGNVIFNARATDGGTLETRIERGLEKALGYPVGVFVRSCAEVAAVAAHEPFPKMPDDCLLHVAFLKLPADKLLKQKLAALRGQDDDFHAHKREVYWMTRGSFGRSPVAVPFGKLVGAIGTMRNVTTIRKLAAKYQV